MQRTVGAYALRRCEGCRFAPVAADRETRYPDFLMAKKFHGTVYIGDDTYGWNFKRGSRVGDGHALGHVVRVWREPSDGRELLLEFPFGVLGFFAWPDHGQLVAVLHKWIPLARENGWDPDERGKPFHFVAADEAGRIT